MAVGIHPDQFAPCRSPAGADAGVDAMAPRFVVNVEVAIHRDGQWLLIERAANRRHAGGTLAFPGGRAERTDGPPDVLEACARREVAEEIGVGVGPLEYLESKSFCSAQGRWVVDVVFLAAWAGGQPRVAAPDEVAQVAWMTYPAVCDDPRTPPWLRQSLDRAEHRLAGR